MKTLPSAVSGSNAIRRILFSIFSDYRCFSTMQPVLRLSAQYYLLPQVVLDAVQCTSTSVLSLYSPGTSITINLVPTYPSSLLITCPYHVNLLSCTFVFHLIILFFILSSWTTPYIHLNIPICLTSKFVCPCLDPRIYTYWSYCCLVYFPLDSCWFFAHRVLLICTLFHFVSILVVLWL